MRKAFFVCAAVAMALAVLAAAQKSPFSSAGEASVLAHASPLPTGAQSTASLSAPVVVLSGVPVRALAINSAPTASDSNQVLYFTRADIPNEIFSVPLPPTADSAPAKITHLAGVSAPGFLGDGGPASVAQFNFAQNSFDFRSGIAVAPDGALFVADTLNSTIRAIGDSSGSAPVIRSVARHWSSVEDIELSAPIGIALARGGDLYIADSGTNSVLLLPAAAGTASTPHKLATLAGVASLAVTPDGGAVFVASPQNGAVAQITTNSRRIRYLIQSAGSAACLNSDLTAAIAPVCPAGLALDGRNNLFIANANDGQILRIDAITGARTVAASTLSEPGDLIFDSQGNLFVAEQGRDRIVELRGMGAPSSSLLLSPGSASFPDVALGSSSPATAFTVTNSSSSAIAGLVVTEAGANPGDFPIASQPCGTTLAPASTCTIAIDFTPTATGARTATLAVADANPSDGATSTLTGGASSIALSPVSAAFPNQPTGGATKAQQFTLTNSSSTTAATGVSVVTTGTNAADFVIQSTNCIPTLPAASSCTLNVAFAPTATATGSRAATLVGTDSNPQDIGVSALSGIGDDYELQLGNEQAQQLSIALGTSATFNLNLVADNNFSGAVSLACPPAAAPGSTSTTELPSYSTCTINPASLTITPGQSVPFTVTIATSAGATTTQPASIRSGAIFAGFIPTWGTPITAIGLLFMLLLFLWDARETQALACMNPSGPNRYPARLRPAYLFGPAALVVLILAGCHHSTPAPSTATPAGTYTLTIQGTAQNAQGASLNVVRGVTVTLVVD